MLFHVVFLAVTVLSSDPSDSGSFETADAGSERLMSSAAIDDIKQLTNESSLTTGPVGNDLLGFVVELVGSRGLVGTITRYSKRRDLYIVTMVSWRLPDVTLDRSEFLIATFRRGARVTLDGLHSSYDGLSKRTEPDGTFLNGESAVILDLISPKIAAVALDKDRDASIRRIFHTSNLRIIGYMYDMSLLSQSVRLDVLSLLEKDALQDFHDAPLDVATAEVIWIDPKTRRCDVVIRSLPQSPLLSKYFGSMKIPELPWRLKNIDVSDLILK